MTITLYTFETADGMEYGSFSTQNYDEAKAYGQQTLTRVIANSYEWADSEMVDDFT